MDQCEHCEARGDLVRCSSLPCTHHETWYVTELRRELADRQGSMDSFRADYLKNESVLKTIHDSLRGREPLDTDPTTQTIQEVRDLYSCVMNLKCESAEAFVDFLIEEGVLLDYGSNIGREPPDDALRRFRAALAEKED